MKKFDLSETRLPNDFSTSIAEFIGIMMGDGFIGKYDSVYVIQITGHKINDLEYYKTYLLPLINNIYDVNAHLYIRHNCIRVTVYSKSIFLKIRRSFNFPVGKKGDITIPSVLLQTLQNKISVIRGLFDTDGSISLQREKYPVLAITTTSFPYLNRLWIYLKS